MSEPSQTEALLRRFYAEQGKLKGYVFSATRDYHATDDILQEVAIVVATKAPDFEDDDPVLPWMIGVAKNLVRRWFREKGKQSRNVSMEVLGDCLPEFGEMAGPELSDRQVALRTCLGKLPERQRSIISMKYSDGLACDRIAEKADCSLQGVYGILKRVKFVLKNCVESQLVKERI